MSFERIKDHGAPQSTSLRVRRRRLVMVDLAASSARQVRYLKIASSHAVIRALKYCPDIRVWAQKKSRKKNKHIARALVAKEIARIVYYVLSSREPFKREVQGRHPRAHEAVEVAAPSEPERITDPLARRVPRLIGRPGACAAVVSGTALPRQSAPLKSRSGAEPEVVFGRHSWRRPRYDQRAVTSQE
ncbi:MAG: hypothetical protein ACT4O1_16935 [Gemmatimonadota bacterium]